MPVLSQLGLHRYLGGTGGSRQYIKGPEHILSRRAQGFLSTSVATGQREGNRVLPGLSLHLTQCIYHLRVLRPTHWTAWASKRLVLRGRQYRNACSQGIDTFPKSALRTSLKEASCQWLQKRKAEHLAFILDL